MSFLKTLGLGAFYRARRITKAVKNWRKFGVILFGSLFLASTVMPNLALADTNVEVTISPTSSEITLGSTKQFSGQVHSGVVNVTSESNISWTASLSGQTVATANGATFNFAPTQAGTYIIRAGATYNGLTGTLREPATLLVRDAGDNTPYTVSITPTNSSIAVGASQNYTPTALYGGNNVTSQSTFDWVVKKNGATVRTASGQNFAYAPTQAGTYTVATRGIYTINSVTKTAWSNTAILTVTGGTGSNGGDGSLEITISPTSAEINLGSSKTYVAQVHNGTLNVTSQSNISWTATFGGQTVATGNGTNLVLTPSTTGTFIIRASATYNGRAGILREPATLLVKGGEVVNNNCSIVINHGGSGNITLGQSSPVYSATVIQNGQNVTSSKNIAWTVMRSGNANVQFSGSGASFSFTPAQTGTYTIQARTQCGDLFVNATVTLTVNPNQSNNCEVFRISPSNVNLQLTNGVATQNFQLIAEDSLGDNDVTLTNIQWRVNGVGSVSPATGSRNVTYTTTQTSNNTVITVSGICNGSAFSNTANVRVTDDLVHTVVIHPSNPTAFAGDVVVYTATAFDSNGHQISNSEVDFYWHLNGFGNSLGHLLNNTGASVSFDTNEDEDSDSYSDIIEVEAVWRGMTASDTASINLVDVIIGDLVAYVQITVDQTPIHTNDETLVRAQAYDNFDNPIANCSYRWEELGGPGEIVGSVNQRVITYASDDVTGSENLKVVATCSGETASDTDRVEIIDDGDLRVVVTPDPAYAEPRESITFRARAYDEDGDDVTSSTNFNWDLVDSDAGDLTSEDDERAVVRTDNELGTFDNALRVTGTRNGDSATDRATIIVRDNDDEDFDITTSFRGSLNTNGTAVCSDDMITYTIVLSNDNHSRLTDVELTMNVPANTRFVSATSTDGSPRVSGDTITWEIGSIGFGASKTMTVRVMPVDKMSGSHTINASAYITFDQMSGGRTITANSIELVCGATPHRPDGKGPLASTGTPWQILVALMAGAMGLAGMTYTLMRRRAQANQI